MKKKWPDKYTLAYLLVALVWEIMAMLTKKGGIPW